MLPEQSLGDKQEVAVQEGIGGKHSVKGFVNAGSPGYIRIAVIDVARGGELPMEKGSTTEYVGWSRDRRVFFPFSVDVWLDEAAPRKPLKFEVRFTSSNIEKALMATDVEEGTGPK